ncbi:DNA polymerase [Staphylococcus hominis]|uniref:DNA polymerase n=1 Tax=Staphylococcus hominis TaxID=1290 RepID=UPI00019FCC8F|nr:DNA polymerase [Staphylococcus hominis]EEK11585.1 DNA polymerase type B, organellar and viral [Staphylococcus hominis SK119]
MKKRKRKDKSKCVFVYADIETYSPSKDPQFWIGGLKQNGVYKAYDNFKDYWDALTKKIKGKKKVVVFHNSSYDISILQYHASRELDYRLNPYEKGQTKAIYTGQYAEVYADDNVQPTFIVDSKALLPGALQKYGEQLGLPKGDTPILEHWRKATDDDWEYLKRDIDILEGAFQAYGHEKSVEDGLLTVSSLAQSSVREILGSKTGKKVTKTGLKRKHGASETEKEKMPLPNSVLRQIERDTEAFREREVVYSIKTKKALYTLNNDVIERYRKYIIRYWTARLSEEVEDFSKRQREVKKKKNGKKYDEELIKGFYDISLPSGKSPHGKKLVEEFHISKIIEGANKFIAPSMRGGMTYVNMDYVGKELENGGVLDVNSLYPFILSEYAIPSVYKGSTDDLEPNMNKYFICQIKRLKATLKSHRHPFLKRSTTYTNDKIYEKELDWVGKEKNGVHDTVLCSVDVNWLFENYDVEEIEYGKIFYFEEDKKFTESVREHIVYWRNKKENAPNLISRNYAKFMLNTIWGRWGMFEKEVDEGARKIDVGDKDTNYVSAIFTTAYARVYLNKMMNWFDEDLIYTDTDSVHFLFGNKVKDEKDLEVKLGKLLDANKFGMWDFEKKWTKAKYMKAKTYAMQIDDKIKTVTAGRQLPKIESLDDFYFGASFRVIQNKTLEDGREIIYPSLYTLEY